MTVLPKLDKQPVAGVLCVLTVLCGLALGHSLVVLQWTITGGISVLETVVSMSLGSIGVALVWMGLSRPENQATFLGYVGGILIWAGFFEWTWRYFSYWLRLAPVMDGNIPILTPGLLVIQTTSLLVIVMLIFLGMNKDTRCRMFMWFHRNLRLRPGPMTPGFKRQYASVTAMETVFLVWFIYLCAITINDPRLIRYDSVAAMAITVGFVFWGIYLVGKLVKVRGLGATFRYAIATGNILWLPVEGFSRWGLYPEFWIRPLEYGLVMSGVFALFIFAGVAVLRRAPRTATNPAAA